MRVMIMAKEGKPRAESKPPSPEDMAAFEKYNDELTKSGIVIGNGRLHPSSTAIRLDFSGDKPEIMDGPFTESKELVAGYWIWQVRSMEEAVEWLKKAPFPGGRFEIRQVMDLPGTLP